MSTLRPYTVVARFGQGAFFGALTLTLQKVMAADESDAIARARKMRQWGQGLIARATAIHAYPAFTPSRETASSSFARLRDTEESPA